MIKVKVHRSGLFTSVQDFGRPHGGDSGLPWGGAMDSHSYRLANDILGNNPLEAVLELTMSGPTLEFLGEVSIAITGADMSPKVNSNAVFLNQQLDLKKGDILSFGELKNGCRSYIAFSDRIDVPLVQGSKSTYLYAGIGGFDGQALKKGASFFLHGKSKGYQKENRTFKPLEISTPLIVRVQPGPEFDKISAKQKEVLFSTIYKVGVDSNRMGVRLKGDAIEGEISGIVSSGVVKGTIQLPPSGLPIILMADASTTGGYLRVLNCKEDSINHLAQLKAGDVVVFELKDFDY